MKTYKILDMGMRHCVFEICDGDMLNLGTHCIAIFDYINDAKAFVDFKNGVSAVGISTAE